MFSSPNLNFSEPVTEIIALIGIFALSFILALFLGRGRMIAFILSFYPAALFYTQFPLSDKLLFLKETELQVFLNNLLIFAIFFIPTFFIINLVTSKGFSYSTRGKMFKVSLLALSSSLLILLTIHQVVVFKGIEKFFPMTHEIWANPQFFFWILVIPLVIILIFVRK